ncbi:MAG TPA: VWA domain-containing protein [Pyrinomonadaceae bacterium]|nr:VWA domain-containing protein [Pyrinomonadaceae bacterium]
MKIRSLTVIFTCLLLSSQMIGQKPTDKNRYPQTGPVKVKLNLIALDEKGEYIEELQASDITLTEDGVEQKLSAVGRKIPPTGVGLVFDNSGSMRLLPPTFDSAGKTIVANLGEKDEGFVVRFVSSDKIEVLQNFTNVKADLVKAIDNLFIEGGHTALIDAVTLAAEKVVEQEEKTPNNRFAIIVMSDGVDIKSYYDLAHLLKIIDGSDVQVFPVFFISEASDGYNSTSKRRFERSNAVRLGQVLALRTGGKAIFFDKRPNDDELNNELRALMVEIRSQYVIEYTSTNQKRDGGSRSLTVKLKDGPNGEKRTGHIRGSFTVPVD